MPDFTCILQLIPDSIAKSKRNRYASHMPSCNTLKRRSDCPLNVSLEIFGDRWTLLIVRDLMLKGRSRFGELLEGGEGSPPTF